MSFNIGAFISEMWQDLVSFLKTTNPVITPTPVVPTPPTPGPNPTPPQPAPAPQVTLADIIVAYNAPFIRTYPIVGGTTIDAQIHQIDQATAEQIATLIQDAATANPTLDPIYLAACIMQESRFDPNCFNHNLSASTPTITFEGTDWGMCQMSGNYLPSKPGMAGLTESQMQTLACTASWAVPVMGSIMAGNLATATAQLNSDAVLAAGVKKYNTTTLTDAQWLATLMYNRGETGAINDVKTGQTSLIEHPGNVGTWFADFNKAIQTGKA